MSGQAVQIFKKQDSEELNPKAKELISALIYHGTFETTTYYADKAGISWNTAYTYLKEFSKRHWIFHVQKGNRDFWKGVAEKQAEVRVREEEDGKRLLPINWRSHKEVIQLVKSEKQETAKKIIGEWKALCERYDKDPYNRMTQSTVEILIDEQEMCFLPESKKAGEN